MATPPVLIIEAGWWSVLHQSTENLTIGKLIDPAIASNAAGLLPRSFFSKAFDKVWHDGLIFKLKQNGISGKLLGFFKSYLTNRKQRVALNGTFSDYASIDSGVPQGSVLGPLLFLIYIKSNNALLSLN